MSPRTYIGPFGRILPLAGGSEPDQLPRPPDEGRAGLHLPQPELNFGSDTNLGFSDPTRYNCSAQPLAPPKRLGSVAEQYRTSGKPLPPMRHLFTSDAQPDILLPSHSSFQPPHFLQQTPLPPNEQSDRYGVSTHSQEPRLFHEQSSSPTRTSYGLAYRGVAAHQTPPSIQHEIRWYDHSSNSDAAPPAFDPYTSGVVGSTAAYEKGSAIPQATSSTIPPVPHLEAYPGDQMPLPNPNEQWETEGSLTFNFRGIAPFSAKSTQQSSRNEVKPTPKVIREEIRPDQGPVWVYEDGSVCPKVVGGEMVNADWGVTKAGKPRKRLALACTSCREKKIKCDPAQPQCAQCEKLGKECKYATARMN